MSRFSIVLRILIILLMLFAGISFGMGVSRAAEPAFVDGQVIIKIDPLSGATIDAINATYGTTTIKPIEGVVAAYLLQAPAGETVDALLARMAGDTRLLYAEPNFLTNAPEGIGRPRWAWGGPSAPPQSSQYAPNLLNLPAAHAITRGAGAIVAVLDTGFQLDHPELSNRLTTARYDFVDNDAIPDNILDTDGDNLADYMSGHGTHVAGIIVQAAPDAQLMLLRVLDTNGVGNSVWVAEAVQYAAANGADVINLSLGAPVESSLIEDAVYQADREYDVVVVAAAGNDNATVSTFPAGINNSVIAVTAVGANSKKTDFANFGSWVDIAAPGESIYSAFPISGYSWWSGTSMAAPWVAGQSALLLSKCPDLDPSKVYDKIAANVTPLAGGLGAGLPNVAKSLEAPCDKDSVDGEDPPDDDGDDEDAGEIEAFVYGTIDSMPTSTEGEWRIGGVSYLVNSATLLNRAEGELAVGKGVLVNSYTDSNGKQIAVVIQGIAQRNTIYLPMVSG